MKVDNWTSCNDRLPPTLKPVMCQLQHYASKNIVESVLIRVDEDDCEWRTEDDNSEIAFEWNVISWRQCLADHLKGGE